MLLLPGDQGPDGPSALRSPSEACTSRSRSRALSPWATSCS
jgi:hypothetical protein